MSGDNTPKFVIPPRTITDGVRKTITEIVSRAELGARGHGFILDIKRVSEELEFIWVHYPVDYSALMSYEDKDFAHDFAGLLKSSDWHDPDASDPLKWNLNGFRPRCWIVS